ncbi:MAG: hypothetical protein LV480_09265 [Methylacidiphilales bacterium]|nr:hypothetical protein [Candidatus Methylacidiphilales bacterium]
MKRILALVLGLLALSSLLISASAADSFSAGQPVELIGTHGKFDFIKIDPARHRLLACHTGNGSLDVIDVATSKLIKSVPTGAAQGVAMDDKNGLYYVSVSKPPQLVIFDAGKLEMTGGLPLPGPADIVAYHAGTNRVFVCNDEKPELWVIDPVARKILTTISLPGKGMEDLGFDDKGDFLFQNLKETSELAKVDPRAEKVAGKWSTLPAEKPHGLAMVPGTHTVLIAGGTGKLSLMDLETGKVLASTDIAQRVDEIAYDPGNKRAYCASGLGTLSVVSVSPDKLTSLDALTTSPGTHSVAVDPQTHAVWIAFAKDGKAYVQAFSPK